MLCSVVINNYNYERYLAEAIESVLGQTYRDIQLIIVDDGSTDGSVAVAERYLADNVVLVTKENGGQLSCFNTALPYIEGELVFFLDSDDFYEKEYIEKTVQYYIANPICDFIFCKPCFVDNHGKQMSHTYRSRPKEHYGYTSVITYIEELWIGSPTSCISMRRELLGKILPIPYEDDWMIRADDCLIWGASIRSGYKCHIRTPFVNYRIHGENYLQGRRIPPHKEYLRELSKNRLFKFLARDMIVSRVPELLRFEFAALPELTLGDLNTYLKAIMDCNMPFRKKLRPARKVISHYLMNRKSKRPFCS